jgi:hypothetical protein
MRTSLSQLQWIFLRPRGSIRDPWYSLKSLFNGYNNILSFWNKADRVDQLLPNFTWRAISLFFKNSYWYRVLIIQEIALAHASYMMGGFVVPFTNVLTFTKMVRICQTGIICRPGFIPLEL